jgi:hypothetical protein
VTVLDPSTELLVDPPSGDRHHRHTRRLLAISLLLVVSITSLVLCARSPAWLLPNFQHDDGLYARLAGSIVDGQWLGAYDRLTVAKGPGYPLFLAVAYKAHLPFRLSEQLVHLFAAAVIALAVHRITRRRLLALITYSVVALDPAFFGATAAKVTRDDLYASLCLLLVGATALFTSLVPTVERRGWRWWVPSVVAFGVTAGVVAAGYYTTRDERQWLGPAVVVALGAGLASWRGPRRALARFAALTFVMALVAGLTTSGSLHWISSRNERFYGTSVISDLVDGQIARAYSDWQRVRTSDERRYVPVDKAQREAVYGISRTAAELAPMLEDRTYWRTGPCTRCDIYGGFFVWALRDAARDAGHATSGREMQRFFGRIADDIERACGTRLRCAARGIGPMPPWYRVDVGAVLSSAVSSGQYLLTYEVAEPTRRTPSGGAEVSWDSMTRPLRGFGPHDQDRYRRYEARLLDQQQGVEFLAWFYRWMSRLAAVPALLGLAAAAVTRAGRRHPAVGLLCLSMLVAVLCRIVLLGATDALSFPSARSGVYILPATGFLLVFLVLGVYLLAEVLRERRVPHALFSRAGAAAADTNISVAHADAGP